MKTLKNILYAFIAVFVLAGCDDSSDYLTGAPEDPDCYNVYFPAQDNATDLELDPAAETKLSFIARRTNSEGAITVPVSVKKNQSGVFALSSIEFADGQEETTFDVTFPDTEIGTKYTCEINIDDTKYASVYGEKSVGITFSVTRVKWNLVTGEGGETKGKWRDDVISSMFGVTYPNAEVELEIYERDDRPGYYRMVPYTQTLISALFGRNVGTCTEPFIILDATDPDKAWFPYQTTGVTLGSDGEIEIASKVDKNFASVSEAASAYASLKDGVVSFPAGGIYVNFTVTGGWYGSNNSGLQRIIFPGAKVYDYALALSKSEPANGVVQLGFTLGADVAKVKYAFFEGSLSEALAETKSKEIDGGELPVKEITATGTVNAVMDETGMYTVLGNIYNAAGELQGYRFLSFGYVKDGDEKPVILTVKANLTWEHVGDGHTPENSIVGTMIGQDIESGYAGVFKTADLKGMTTSKLEETVKKSGKAFTAENLEKINAKGYSPLFTGLSGGTDYTLLVWAFNGYYGKVYAVKQTTEGKLDPLAIHYTFADIQGEVSKEDLFNTTWNYYAVDVFDEDDATNRQFLGTVTFSENAENAAYVKVKGLSSYLAPNLSTKDDTFLAAYNGLVSPMPKAYFGMYKTYHVGNMFTYEENPTGINGSAGCLYAGYVDDGMLAFVPNPNYVAQGYTFVGIYWGGYNQYNSATGAFTGLAADLVQFNYLMLVNPANDSNAKTAAAVARELPVRQTNFVELRGPALTKAIWNEQIGNPANRAVEMIDVAAQADAKIADAKVTFTKGIVPVTSDPMQMIGRKVKDVKVK